MNQILERGRSVRTESSGIDCKVVRFLGGGGQGEVYAATLDSSSVALKWYYPSSATVEQRKALETLVQKGPPTDRFLWPMELASAAGVAGFGYVMPLRDSRYKGIADLMSRRVDTNFRALATAGMELADSYFQLHSKGLCYRDISFGNVFFDPADGHVLICDNDNVTVNGSAMGGIKGTPRFMAPEVVRDEAPPSTRTDLFSLSVLLFYMFMTHHPLEGKREAAIKCFDLPAMTRLYGTEPLFVFDPVDDSNRPVPGYHQNAIEFWPIYPQFLGDLFTKAFTEGIRDPQNGRVAESIWRAAMARLRDSILYCAGCSAENFYDADALKADGRTRPCWSCRTELQLPPRIRIGKGIVMLNHDTRLFPHHIDDQRPYDFSRPVAEVARHPNDPGIWGLRNVTNDRWVTTMADGTVKDVEPGRSITLSVGTKINFGRSEGEIRL